MEKCSICGHLINYIDGEYIAPILNDAAGTTYPSELRIEWHDHHKSVCPVCGATDMDRLCVLVLINNKKADEKSQMAEEFKSMIMERLEQRMERIMTSFQQMI